jgi:Domain of unknown function (DUF4159)
MLRPSTLVSVLVVAFALSLSTLAPPAQARDKPRELLVEQVRKAIDRGVQFLRDQERGTGNWESADQVSVITRGGWTSLSMLALLNSGVKPNDPIIERGLKFLRDIEPNQTYVVALQTMVFVEAGRNEDIERIQRNVNWLIDAMVKENGRCRGWTYGKGPGPTTDNSNTQYALLGLHAGHVAGAKIDRQVWEMIREYYISTQEPDHGWVYNRSIPTSRTTLTMTTAGLCGLLISGLELNRGREIIRADGTATNCGVYEENRPTATALGWVADHFQIQPPYNIYYNLYGIERAGRLSGQRFFGEHDWYREGCEYLVREQHEDGSWYKPDTPRDGYPVISTSFSLLFLSKGRMPVLISKLVHDPGQDWNNDRNDARNVVEYASKEVFRRLPMAWQVFDAGRVEVKTDEDIGRLVGDLLQSPIAYFNGHQAPKFADVEKKILQQYVEQGGFILAEACCGRKEFDEGFRKLMQELFPDNPLKKLPPEHPIWRAHSIIPPDSFPLEGIEYGCKTVVLYSPQDLSCLWEANQYQNGRGQLAFRLAGNIIAYATGMEPPKPRLTPPEVVQDDPEGKQIQRGFLKVAQLRHEGDWQPAPNAMRNLMAHLRRTAQLDVTLQTKPIYATDPDLMDFRFLYMHGRGTFSLSPKGIDNLRLDLETGGLLFADACCGRKAFDTSFRDLMSRLFPKQPLEPIPVTDDLYGNEVNGTPIITVRCRTELAGGAGQPGELREVPPFLEGIRIGKRWAVIYSKYDIGCALEKRQSTECLGHDHESALRLGSAAVLYALKR